MSGKRSVVLFAAFAALLLPAAVQAGTITGQVTTADGVGIAAASVFYGDRQVETDDAGNYSTGEVPAGDVSLVVFKDGFRTEQREPRSTADLLKAIPGFYVESSGGEVGGNLFARGLPADGSFRYVAMMEDGMPVYDATGSPGSSPPAGCSPSGGCGSTVSPSS